MNTLSSVSKKSGAKHLKAEPKILKVLIGHRGPFMARITPGGHVSLLPGYFGEKKPS